MNKNQVKVEKFEVDNNSRKIDKQPKSTHESTLSVEVKHSESIKRKIFLSRIKRKLFQHVWLVRVGIIISLFAVVFLLGNLIITSTKNTTLGNYLSLAKNFIFTPEENIKSLEGRTNILILGKGGQNHNAPDLTDTIIFMSIDGVNDKISLISLPRDIWIPALRAKLNSTYYWGNQKQEDGGLKLTKSSVEEIVGQPVHYGLVVDFNGFEEIINIIDGVDVDVENTFTDTKFPIEGKENDECGGDPDYLCRYETISFQKGLTKMNGDLALKYVRSRNSSGDEGTDIARAQRQQKLIFAIKDKLLSKDVLLSPKILLKLKDASSKYVEADIDSSALAIMARRFYQAKNNVSSHVLSEEFLINPPKSVRYDNLYVFIPKNESWEEIQNWVECILKNGSCD